MVSKREFDEEMAAQKSRSRSAGTIETGDWVVLSDDETEEFVGYDYLETSLKITRYRKVKMKDKELFQLVFNLTPFYAEGGGQLGDKGYIESNDEKIEIIDTKKEHNQIIHFTKKLPKFPESNFKAVVSGAKRKYTEANHSATHLLHYALRKVLVMLLPIKTVPASATKPW